MARLTQEDQEALAKIRQLLNEHEPDTNWEMPAEYAFKCAHEIPSLQPAAAIKRAEEFIKELKEHNVKKQKELVEARKRKEELQQNPITNAGARGIYGFIQRWFLAWLNATPMSNFNWMEVNQEGLNLYQPFATVSLRTIKHKDVKNNEVTLSVDPPAYLDGILAVIKQFRKETDTPWGEIVIFERGGGKVVARAVARWPSQKIKEMKKALQQLHIVENPFEDHKRLPRLRDLLIYYDIEQIEAAQHAEEELITVN